MLILFLILYLTLNSFVNYSYAKVNLRHSQTNKNFINQLDAGSFEIVYPFQVRDRNERIGIDTHNYFLNATVHYKHAVIVIRSNAVANVRLKLALTLNNNLFLNETQFKKLDEHGESDIGGHFENCYYQGIVNNDPSSFVAISTCNGLWGIIAFENGTTFGIWPLDSGDRAKRHPHILYRAHWNRDASCGALSPSPPEFSAYHSGGDESISKFAKIKRDVTLQTKYLELAVVGDFNFVQELNASDAEAAEYILNAINIADAVIHRSLRIRLSLVYAEVWMDAQRVDLHSDIQRTLSGVLDYVTGHIYHVEKDASVMFTGGYFANSEMLSSTFSSVCSARSVGLVKAIDPHSIHATSQLIAHTVGHIVGIDHDSAECVCADNVPCIMSRQIGSIDSVFAWEFSKCSIARLHNVLQSEHFQCLLTQPFYSSRLHSCGNGVVDGDEQCDCGRRDECFDPCCDPITCTLRAHARCASHQACCHRCELRHNGHVCRESQSVCDVPETCDGVSGDCPADGHLIDGVLCGINGHCWKGNCSDSEQQCRDIWGSGAKLADEPCFDYNEKGVEYGNCGTNRNGEFVGCTSENRKCGTLHCRDGAALPEHSSLTSFNLQFLHDGHPMQCKVITGSESAVALVRDGTICASGKVCIENACVPLAQVSAPIVCPSNNVALQCSGHGDCTTTQKCLCYDGWMGAACDIRSNTSRRILFPKMVMPSSSNDPHHHVFPTLKGQSLDTIMLLGILFAVGIFLLLLLICLLFCYRRRSNAEMHRSHLHDKVEDESQENIGRAIKFGQMPSYREEKRKRKKNKRVYDALQRITEAVEERDSVSLKSRESSIVGQNSVVDASAPPSANANGTLCNGGAHHAALRSSITNLMVHTDGDGGDGGGSNFQRDTMGGDGNNVYRAFYRSSNDCVTVGRCGSVANDGSHLDVDGSSRMAPHNFDRSGSSATNSLPKFSMEHQSQQYLLRNGVDKMDYHQQPSSVRYPYQTNNASDCGSVSARSSFENGGGAMAHNGHHQFPPRIWSGSGRNILAMVNGGGDGCYQPSDVVRQGSVPPPQRHIDGGCTGGSSRSGYATDSELTSGFGGNAMLSERLAERNGYGMVGGVGYVGGSHFGGSNRNSAENANGGVANPLCNGGILSDSECLNGATPPPSLRLQSIQMLMKRLNEGDNDGNEALSPSYNNFHQFNSQPTMNGKPAASNGFEMSELKLLDRGGVYHNQNVNNNLQYHDGDVSPSTNGGLLTASVSTAAISGPEPPPASVDSGHPCSNYGETQEDCSPSLFTDTFKLDLSS